MKILPLFEKTENTNERGRGWPIKKSQHLFYGKIKFVVAVLAEVIFPPKKRQNTF